jgi:porin
MRRLLPLIICTAPTLTAAANDCVDCASAPVIAVEAAYTGEIWSQASGGIASGVRYLDNVSVALDIDAERAFGFPRTRIYSNAFFNNGDGLCAELVGAAQCVSNIEASRAARVYEVWSEWASASGADSVRFGLYDLNSEFDSIETAGLFINPSHGIGADFAQSGEQGPSIFPVTALGVRARRDMGAWSIQAAALDAVAGDPDRPGRSAIKLSRDDGALLVGEVDYRRDSGARFGAGAWRYTAEHDDLETGGPRDDNGGFYLLAESPRVFEAASGAGLNAFVRLGEAEANINPIERYLGAGVVYSSASTSGRARQLGLAAAIAELGSPYRRALASEGQATTSREYAWEATYRREMSSWLTLQADVQYIDNPGMDPQLHGSWTVGLRVEVAGGWSR